MASFQISDVTNQTEWDTFIAAHQEANFLHSWQWGAFHQRIQHQVVRRGFYHQQRLVGVMLAIVEPARRGRHLVVPGGPILDWDQPDLAELWAKELKRVARELDCVFVRVRPQLLDTSESRQLFKQLKLIKAPMHLHAELTSQLDITKDDETLKKAMRKGTRYEINRAARENINVEQTTNDDWLDQFYDLQLETAKRQNFVPFSKAFLSEQFREFAASGNALMYRATKDGKLLTMAFIIFYGSEAAYHYGASTDLAREFPGAYAIQWQAIKEARARGCKRYNFWGVAEHGATKHRFYGVSVFKRGFGGEDVAYLPAHDLIVSKSRYLLNYSVETARRKVRHL
jgi:lipid II:glycine glycyltransferase (peptidoglycan interpeptide bridge formation enzyme)